jgi:formate dehydrogenase subunit gamma
VSAPARVRRFSRTERLAHWLLAVAFFVMLGSGLALLLPSLAGVIDRPTAKAWHLDASFALVAGLVVLGLVGDRRGLRRVAAEVDRFDRDDARWLRRGPAAALGRDEGPPQGRFNAGQKLNALLIFGLMGVMYVTGLLLLEGEADTRFRFAGTVMVHDWGMLVLLLLVAGHLYLAVLHPTTRHALRGITLGDVDRGWATHHHRKWVEGLSEDEPEAPPTARPAAPAASAGTSPS